VSVCSRVGRLLAGGPIAGLGLGLARTVQSSSRGQLGCNDSAAEHSTGVMTPTRLSVVICSLGLSVACAGDPAELLSREFREQRAADLCPQEICGNTPHLGTFAFWELDEQMEKYSPVGGFRIVSLTAHDGDELTPVVDHFHFSGLDEDGRGRFVEGGKMRIESDSGQRFEVKIDPGLGGLHYSEGGHVAGDPDLPTFQFSYAELVEFDQPVLPFQGLCPSSGGSKFWRDALVFQGDRYDLVTGDVDATGGGERWFNIACSDDAMWKLFLMRHAHAASNDDFQTSEEDREAGLRSIRADYCGDGSTWTEPGVDVDWINRGRWLEHDEDAYPNLEAIWDENGARCLNHPRLFRRVEVECPGKTLNWCKWGDELNASFHTYVPKSAP
jgi:ADYC domain